MSDFKVGEHVEVLLRVKVDGENYSKWASGYVYSITYMYIDKNITRPYFNIHRHLPQEWVNSDVLGVSLDKTRLRKFSGDENV